MAAEDRDLLRVLTTLSSILGSPKTLAYLFLAAGAPVLDRVGRILTEIVEEREEEDGPAFPVPIPGQ